MPLRNLARKLRVPTTAALKRASPAGGSRPVASRSSQNGEAKKGLKGTRDLSDYEKAMIALDNLPRVCVLSAGAGVLIASTLWAYVCGAFGGSKKFPA